MKKKVVSLCLVALLAMGALIGGTMAYFTGEDKADNVITVGSVSAELYESKYHRGAPTGYLSMDEQPNPTTDNDIIEDASTYENEYLKNATLMPFDLTKDQDMFEACTVAKNAYVKNTGDNDCFVRVTYAVPKDIAPYLDIYYVNTQFITANDAIASANATTLDNTDKNEPMITTVKSTEANFAVQVGDTNKETIDGKEYYVAEFIYAERLTPGEMTLYSPISKITMIPSVTNEQIEKLNLTDRQFDIKVIAEVIQADGFSNAVKAFEAFDAQ